MLQWWTYPFNDVSYENLSLPGGLFTHHQSRNNYEHMNISDNTSYRSTTPLLHSPSRDNLQNRIMLTSNSCSNHHSLGWIIKRFLEEIRHAVYWLGSYGKTAFVRWLRWVSHFDLRIASKSQKKYVQKALIKSQELAQSTSGKVAQYIF